jgi:hypothetical protein
MAVERLCGGTWKNSSNALQFMRANFFSNLLEMVIFSPIECSSSPIERYSSRCERSKRRVERSPSVSERLSSLAERPKLRDEHSSPVFKRSASLVERSKTLFERSPPVFERSSALFERSQRVFERSKAQGTDTASPGSRILDPRCSISASAAVIASTIGERAGHKEVSHPDPPGLLTMTQPHPIISPATKQSLPGEKHPLMHTES